MADSEMDLQVDGKSIYSLRVVDLKQELKKRDIPFKGNANKTQLQALLIQHLTQPSEANDDKSPEDNSGTTVHSDDTNDTIESNSENNVSSLGDKPAEQTEATDLSQDSGITSSVSFGDKHSIKLTIKLGNDSPGKQMSPKKSPSKEMRSPPLEGMRQAVKASEPLEEKNSIAVEETQEKIETNEVGGGDQLKKPLESSLLEKTSENQSVVVAQSSGDTTKNNSDEVTGDKPSEVDSTQSDSLDNSIKDDAKTDEEKESTNKTTDSYEDEKHIIENVEVQEKVVEESENEDKSEKKEIEEKENEENKIEEETIKEKKVEETKTEEKKIEETNVEEKKEVIEEKVAEEKKIEEKVVEEKKNEERETVIREKDKENKESDETEKESMEKETKEVEEISLSQNISDQSDAPIEPIITETAEKSETNATKEDQESDKMMIQEIVLTEEVSDDLSEQRVDIPDSESVQQICDKSKESTDIKVALNVDQKDKKQISPEKENKLEVDTKSDKARPPRRRRWGGSVSSDAQQSARKGISSDQLKELIPDLDSADNSNATSKVSKSESIVVTSSLSRTPTEANSEVPLKQDIRVVRKSVSVSEEDQNSVKVSVPVTKQKIVVDTETKAKEEEPKRAVSPPRKPESNIVFIQNLVRPFTLLQLKEVLGKTGKLIEERFWIDKIKSKCFATYETNEEAVATRLALHGTRWPSSNPKVLAVDFATNEELDSLLNPELNNKKTEPNQKYDIVIKSEEQRTITRDKENKTENRPIREWDREKLSIKEDDKRTAVKKRAESPRSKSQERENKRRRTGEERVRPADSTSGEQLIPEASKETESPAKLLDDLFRKTTATPSIYWLPLTEDQASARSAQREEEEKKRTEERLAREEQMRKRQEEIRRPFDGSPPFRNDRRRPDSPNRRPMNRRTPPQYRRSPPNRRSPPRRRSPFNRYSRSRSPIARRKR